MPSNELPGTAIEVQHVAPDESEEIVVRREDLDRRLARVAEEADALSRRAGVEIGPDGNVLVGKEGEELLGVDVAPQDMYRQKK